MALNGGALDQGLSTELEDCCIHLTLLCELARPSALLGVLDCWGLTDLKDY